MRKAFGIVILALLSLVAAGFLQAASDAPPPWAYGFATAADGAANPPAAPAAPAAAPAPVDATPKQVPGSSASFPLAQIRDAFGPADWFPGDHPQMPDVVAHGRRPDVRACSLCHYPNGKGRPENAGVAGLPYDYFVQTMNDFKTGARKSADSRKANTNVMIAIAKGMSDEEVKAAATYFGSMKWTPWIKVVEAATVPKTRIAGGMFLRMEGNEKEPSGGRHIERAEEKGRTRVLRHPRSGHSADAPEGRTEEGEKRGSAGGGGQEAGGARRP